MANEVVFVRMNVFESIVDVIPQSNKFVRNYLPRLDLLIHSPGKTGADDCPYSYCHNKCQDGCRQHNPVVGYASKHRYSNNQQIVKMEGTLVDNVWQPMAHGTVHVFPVLLIEQYSVSPNLIRWRLCQQPCVPFKDECRVISCGILIYEEVVFSSNILQVAPVAITIHKHALLEQQVLADGTVWRTFKIFPYKIGNGVYVEETAEG